MIKNYLSRVTKPIDWIPLTGIVSNLRYAKKELPPLCSPRLDLADSLELTILYSYQAVFSVSTVFGLAGLLIK